MSQDILAQARISSKNQITLPKKVLRKLGEPEPGNYILFFDRNGVICIGLGAVQVVRSS